MRVSQNKFSDLVARVSGEVVRSMPPDLRDKAGKVMFIARDRPSKEQSAATGGDDDGDDELLGLYEGTPLVNRGVEDGIFMPDRITLFRVPLQEMCRNGAELREEIRITVIHELGHFFGFEEEDLIARGLE